MRRKKHYLHPMPDILYDCIASHNPSDEAVHKQTMKYIHDDFQENAHKYTLMDQRRLALMIADDSAIGAKK